MPRLRREGRQGSNNWEFTQILLETERTYQKGTSSMVLALLHIATSRKQPA